MVLNLDMIRLPAKLLILELTPFQIESHEELVSGSINILALPWQKKCEYPIFEWCMNIDKEMIGTGPALANISGYIGLAEHS